MADPNILLPNIATETPSGGWNESSLSALLNSIQNPSQPAANIASAGQAAAPANSSALDPINQASYDWAHNAGLEEYARNNPGMGQPGGQGGTGQGQTGGAGQGQTGGTGQGGAAQSFTPMTEDNPLAKMLRDIGVTGPLTGSAPSVNNVTGAYLTGSSPTITSPFRHLFNQDQINDFAIKTPTTVSTMGADGKINSQSYNWWDPNASLSAAISSNNGDTTSSNNGDTTQSATQSATPTGAPGEPAAGNTVTGNLGQYQTPIDEFYGENFAYSGPLIHTNDWGLAQMFPNKYRY